MRGQEVLEIRLFEVIDKNWQSEFTKVDLKNQGRLRVVSPFIKLPAAKTLIVASNPSDLEVITRYNLEDFYKDVSDIEALEYLLSKGARIQGISKLHSKLYLYDNQRALVTSANLTGGGMRSNFEFGCGSNDGDFITACHEYFDTLWDNHSPFLSFDETTEWKSTIEKKKVSGGKTKDSEGDALPDLGRQLSVSKPNLPTRPHSNIVKPELLDNPLGFQSFVKFLGEGDNRALRSLTTFEELESSGAHWSVGYPKNRRPRQPQDGDVMFISRLVHTPNDVLIFGRAKSLAHDEVRDVATPEDIAVHNWRATWDKYIRIYDAEFLEGNIGNGISLRDLEKRFGPNTYMPTQRNLINGHGNTLPSKAYQQAAGVQLTDVAYDWLNKQFNDHKTRHGIVSEEKIEALYVPKVTPSKYPRHFQLELKKTYYNNSYFNPPVKHGVTLATGTINLYLGLRRQESEASSKRYIANENNPRIFTDNLFQKWKHENFRIGDTLEVTIEGPNSIWLR